MTHPTYGGPRPDLSPVACPCCRNGSQSPAFRMCDPYYQRAVRLMACVHEEKR